MLSEIIAYSEAMLTAIANFLGSEPLIYIVGFILIAVTVKILLRLIGRA